MKLRHIVPAALIAVTVPAAAEAGCNHLGTTYPVGATRCWSGWLERCTVAGYWGAIGQCKKNAAPTKSESDVKGDTGVKMKDKDKKAK